MIIPHRFWLVVGCLILPTLLISCESYNILVWAPCIAKSHYRAIKPIVFELAARGNNVTLLNYVPMTEKTANITEIVPEKISNRYPSISSGTSILLESSVYTAFLRVVHFGEEMCNDVFSSKNIQAFLKEKQKFDLIIFQAFVTDCFLSIVEHFKAPFIYFSSCTFLPWYHNRMALPDNPSYIPHVVSGFESKMTFSDRVENWLTQQLLILYFDYYMQRRLQAISDKYLPNCGKSLQEIGQNAALSLRMTHYTINGPFPLVPSVIEVGGIHLEHLHANLPPNIEKWIDESTHGVIYFCMGSMIKGHSLPDDKRKVFLRAFGRLKQRVLWKWENETMPGKPDNVMIQKWMPQFDILCHPNVKAFISHGGLLGTTEAVHCGVPMVVIPQFADQFTNARALEAQGGGVILNFREADEEMVYNTIQTVLNPEFNKKAKELSARFRDRPKSPIDTAMYWIDYVARHKGAHHMRTAAVGMPLYQYLLLDVFAFLTVVVFITLFVIIIAIKLVRRLLTSLLLGNRVETKEK